VSIRSSCRRPGRQAWAHPAAVRHIPPTGLVQRYSSSVAPICSVAPIFRQREPGRRISCRSRPFPSVLKVRFPPKAAAAVSTRTNHRIRPFASIRTDPLPLREGGEPGGRRRVGRRAAECRAPHRPCRCPDARAARPPARCSTKTPGHEDFRCTSPTSPTPAGPWHRPGSSRPPLRGRGRDRNRTFSAVWRQHLRANSGHSDHDRLDRAFTITGIRRRASLLAGPGVGDSTGGQQHRGNCVRRCEAQQEPANPGQPQHQVRCLAGIRHAA